MDHEVEQYTSKRRLASKLSWGGYQKGGEYAMQQLVIWAVFCSLVLVLCLIRPNAGRIFVGLSSWSWRSASTSLRSSSTLTPT
jgi:hypothetical protein